MLCETPMITWHGESLHSCDFDPNTRQLVTAGIHPQQEYIRMWKIITKDEILSQQANEEREPCARLSTFDLYFEGNISGNFTYPCNMIRFSPNGEMLGVVGD